MKKSIAILIVCLTCFCFSEAQAQEPRHQTKQTKEHMYQQTKYALHGKLVAQEGKGQELADILLEAAALMKTAKGCHVYVVGIQQENPEEVWVTEIWDSKEDHDNSLSIPGVRELIARAMPILNGSPGKSQEWTVLGGTGIEP